MKTPITVIRATRSFSPAAVCGERDHKALEADAALIVTHTDHLSELLTTLFDVSARGGSALHLAGPTDLGALVRDVTEGMQSSARHHIKVSADRASWASGTSDGSGRCS